LIIAYSWSIFASPINILQEKRCGFLQQKKFCS
jgi:hypothetical protein